MARKRTKRRLPPYFYRGQHVRYARRKWEVVDFTWFPVSHNGWLRLACATGETFAVIGDLSDVTPGPGKQATLEQLDAMLGTAQIVNGWVDLPHLTLDERLAYVEAAAAITQEVVRLLAEHSRP